MRSIRCVPLDLLSLHFLLYSPLTASALQIPRRSLPLPVPLQLMPKEQRNPTKNQQHGHLHKRSNSRCKRLIAPCAVNCYGYCYRKLKIVGTCREGLDYRHFVGEASTRAVPP